MAPTKVDLIDHYKGDTWVGMTVGPILINGTQPPTTLSEVNIDFKDKDDNLGYRLSSNPGAGEGTITIVDANTWEVLVPKQDLPLDAGDLEEGMKNKKYWYYDFQTIDSESTKLTTYKGKIKVYEDVTD